MAEALAVRLGQCRRLPRMRQTAVPARLRF